LDVKAIIIPELSPQYSPSWKVTLFRESRDDYEGQITIITLSEFVRLLKTCYHSWLELLYTNYYYCNPKLKHYWDDFRNLRERIVRYDDFHCLDALMDYLNEQSSIARKHGNMGSRRRENKRVAYTCRIKRLLDNYIAGLPYEKNFLLDETEKEELLYYKLYSNLGLEERLAIIDDYIATSKAKVEEYKQNNKNIVDNEVFEILKILCDAILLTAQE
jgi:hypothetical protein